jgi:hypothetical protein
MLETSVKVRKPPQVQRKRREVFDTMERARARAFDNAARRRLEAAQRKKAKTEAELKRLGMSLEPEEED